MWKLRYGKLYKIGDKIGMCRVISVEEHCSRVDFPDGSCTWTGSENWKSSKVKRVSSLFHLSTWLKLTEIFDA